MIYQIAIDGPSGAGKSTVAIELASLLGIDYIDTGAMYRAVALAVKRAGIKKIDCDHEKDIKDILKALDIDFSEGEILLDGESVESQIRNDEIAKLASDVSALPFVRERLVAMQRELGSKKSVILDGRDIASNVFPKAKYKFYITADSEERARRRWNDLKVKDPNVSYEEVLEDMKSRDYNDMNRKLNPLKKVDDAIEVNTTGNSVEESARILLEYIGG